MEAPKCCGKKMTAFAIDNNTWSGPHVFFQCKKCKDVEIKDAGEYPSVFEADPEDNEEGDDEDE